MRRAAAEQEVHVEGDPRQVLKRQITRANEMGFVMNAGMEAEFFLFRPSADGGPATLTHDVGGYFDLAPMDRGEDARRAIVAMLEQLGFEVEAAHHEVAHGQHDVRPRKTRIIRRLAQPVLIASGESEAASLCGKLKR